jgi:hypothetical protein
MLTSMLEFAKDEIKPDALFWTGDNSAHNVWDNTQDEIVAYTVNITKTINEAFKDSKISVFPI